MTDTKAKENAGTLAPDARSSKVMEEVLSLHEHAKGKRSGWDSHWQALGNYVQPRKAYITEGRTVDSPVGEKESQLFDSTAIQANMTLASGHMSWMTPAESQWFSFAAPPEFEDDDEVRSWFHRCTSIAQLEFSRSNLYTEIHEAYLDRGCFGTASFYVGESKNGGVTFRNDECGSYSVMEDDEGMVDTHLRDFTLTYRQAIQKYGDAVCPKIKEEYAKEPMKCGNKEIEMVQAVYPRLERDAKSPHMMHLPVASVHVDKTNKHVCKQGGFEDFPYAVSRYLKWGKAPYGWSPSWIALPDSRQLQFLSRNLDLLTELVIFPRLLAPTGLKGQVDLRPGGITYLQDGLAPEQGPKEWATVGDIKQGMEREQVKRDSINKAFHVDLFQMFSQMEPKQMTAREVAERASEKLIQFSPTFSRLTVEFYIPILKRAFRLLFNLGKFPPPPRQLMQQMRSGAWFLPEPKVGFNSRVSLAMEQLENVGFLRTMDGLAPIAQIQPNILDHYNWNRIARDMARNEGLKESWLLPAAQVEQMQAQRAQRMAEMEQAQIAEGVAGAAQKLGTVPPDSPVSKLIQQRAGALPGMS